MITMYKNILLLWISALLHFFYYRVPLCDWTIILKWLTNVDFLSIMNLKEALAKYQEVVNNLEFARELQKSFLTLGQEVGLE